MAEYIADLIADTVDDSGRIDYRTIADTVTNDGRIDEVLALETTNIDVRKVQHLLQTDDFYNNIERHELNRYVMDRYGNYPLEYDYKDPEPDPTLANSMTSSAYSNVFKIKYNQIYKVLSEGYDSVYTQSVIRDAYSANDDFKIIDSDDPFAVFKSMYDTNLSTYELLKRMDRIYLRNGGTSSDALVVKYLTVPEEATSDQISQEQIRDLIQDVRDINKELAETDNSKVNRVMIISFNRLSSSARNTISNMSYYTEKRSGTVVEHRIAYELFYHNQLIYNVLKSTFVPVHVKLTDDQVVELFSKTGWTRDTLQGISNQDPIVVYQGFKVDDIIKIYRKSHSTTEIARYSVAYRVVRPIPLFISVDDTKQNRFVDMLTE